MTQCIHPISRQPILTDTWDKLLFCRSMLMLQLFGRRPCSQLHQVIEICNVLCGNTNQFRCGNFLFLAFSKHRSRDWWWCIKSVELLRSTRNLLAYTFLGKLEEYKIIIPLLSKIISKYDFVIHGPLC
jgi:hypothetical protein